MGLFKRSGLNNRPARTKKGINLIVTGDNILIDTRLEEKRIILINKDDDSVKKIREVVGYGPETEGVEIGDIVEINRGFLASVSIVTDHGTERGYGYLSYRGLCIKHTGDSRQKLLASCTMTFEEANKKIKGDEVLKESSIILSKKKR